MSIQDNSGGSADCGLQVRQDCDHSVSAQAEQKRNGPVVFMNDINAAKSLQSEPPKMKEITPDQASLLADVFLETEAFYKIKISLEPVSKDVTIIYHDIDEQDFNYLLESGNS